jgi:hypothetical protein
MDGSRFGNIWAAKNSIELQVNQMMNVRPSGNPILTQDDYVNM